MPGALGRGRPPGVENAGLWAVSMPGVLLSAPAMGYLISSSEHLGSTWLVLEQISPFYSQVD